MEPEVTKFGFLDLQVCVPQDSTDDKVKKFAEEKYPCGTNNGWSIRRKGDALLAGCDERVKCEGRDGFVHIMLDA